MSNKTPSLLTQAQSILLTPFGLDDADLTLPHPRAHERAFVCVPWLDVDPAATLPQGPIASLALDRGGVVRRSDLSLTLPEEP